MFEDEASAQIVQAPAQNEQAPAQKGKTPNTMQYNVPEGIDLLSVCKQLLEAVGSGASPSVEVQLCGPLHVLFEN